MAWKDLNQSNVWQYFNCKRQNLEKKFNVEIGFSIFPEDLIQEYLFEKKMEPIIKKRLEDGQKPIPVNLEDLL